MLPGSRFVLRTGEDYNSGTVLGTVYKKSWNYLELLNLCCVNPELDDYFARVLIIRINKIIRSFVPGNSWNPITDQIYLTCLRLCSIFVVELSKLNHLGVLRISKLLLNKELIQFLFYLQINTENLEGGRIKEHKRPNPPFQHPTSHSRPSPHIRQ